MRRFMDERRQAEIYDLLYRLGVSANYTGFFYTAYAVALCAQQSDRLLLVTKWLYPEVAKQYGTKWQTVERNIRTVGNIIWRENRSLLECLAHRPLAQKPCNAQILAILSASLNAALPPHGLGQAVALAGEDHDMGVVDEPVNESGSEAVVPEYSIPLAELQIGGDDETFPFIAV